MICLIMQVTLRKKRKKKWRRGGVEKGKEGNGGRHLPIVPTSSSNKSCALSWVERRINWCLWKQFRFLNGSHLTGRGTLWDNKYICVKLTLKFFLHCKLPVLWTVVWNLQWIPCWSSADVLFSVAAEVATICFGFHILSLKVLVSDLDGRTLNPALTDRTKLLAFSLSVVFLLLFF